MDFKLTEDQNIFFDSVRKFAANTLAADSVARANSDLPKECFTKMSSVTGTKM